MSEKWAKRTLIAKHNNRPLDVEKEAQNLNKLGDDLRHDLGDLMTEIGTFSFTLDSSAMGTPWKGCCSHIDSIISKGLVSMAEGTFRYLHGFVEKVDVSGEIEEEHDAIRAQHYGRILLEVRLKLLDNTLQISPPMIRKKQEKNDALVVSVEVSPCPCPCPCPCQNLVLL